MDTTVYSTDTIGNIANSKFISVRIQFDSTARDNEKVRSWLPIAHELEKQYQVKAYPTYLFFNSDGEIVDKYTGVNTQNPVASFAEILYAIQDSTRQYYLLKRKYDNGNKSPELLKKFAIVSMEHHDAETAQKVSKEYLSTQKNLTSDDNLKFLAQLTQSSKDTGFYILLQNQKRTDVLLRKGVTDSLIESIIFDEDVFPSLFSSDRNTGNSKDFQEPNWAGIQTKLQQYPLLRDKILAYTKVLFYNAKKEKDSCVQAAIFYLKLYGDVSQLFELYGCAANIFSYSSDTAELNEALKWSRKSFEENNNPVYIETYANILYKLNKKNDAVTWEQKALDAADNDRKEKYQTILDKMKKGEQVQN